MILWFPFLLIFANAVLLRKEWWLYNIKANFSHPYLKCLRKLMFPLSAYQRLKNQHEVYSKQNKNSLQTWTGKDHFLISHQNGLPQTTETGCGNFKRVNLSQNGRFRENDTFSRESQLIFKKDDILTFS